MSKIKSFRGMLTNSEQQQIYLGGGDSDTGYKIHNFRIMSHVPGDNNDQEHVVMLWKSKRTAAQLADTTTSRPNFTSDDLLGVAVLVNDIGSSLNYDESIIFDHEVVNQDIFITLRDVAGGAQSCNYYIEFEEIKMSKNEQAVVNFKAALIHTE